MVRVTAKIALVSTVTGAPNLCPSAEPMTLMFAVIPAKLTAIGLKVFTLVSTETTPLSRPCAIGKVFPKSPTQVLLASQEIAVLSQPKVS